VDCGKPKALESRPFEPSVVILFGVAVIIILTGAYTSELEIFDDLSEEE